MSKNIHAQQAYEWLKNGEAILIDVREPEEFGAEHIAYASHVPLRMVGDMLQYVNIPPGRKMIFQCKKGARGSQACNLLASLTDIQNRIYNIEGGIDGWKTAGLPVITVSSTPKISIFRQVQMIIGGLLFALIITGLAGIGFAFVLAAIIAGIFAFTGIIGWCGLALLLQKMPWNK